mmetsp:Transcript_14275/g.32988  ORF Transcript_14275/g.32988 Transcript_14275/m.32988 type:complete len:160 (+) Transcript_14275:460-939(+)
MRRRAVQQTTCLGSGGEARGRGGGRGGGGGGWEGGCVRWSDAQALPLPSWSSLLIVSSSSYWLNSSSLSFSVSLFLSLGLPPPICVFSLCLCLSLFPCVNLSVSVSASVSLSLSVFSLTAAAEAAPATNSLTPLFRLKLDSQLPFNVGIHHHFAKIFKH